jgi:hypothetical protein
MKSNTYDNLHLSFIRQQQKRKRFSHHNILFHDFLVSNTENQLIQISKHIQLIYK